MNQDKVANDRELPPVTFDQICPKFSLKMRKNGGLSYYLRDKVIHDYQYCIVGEARNHIDYNVLEFEQNAFLKLLGRKPKQNPNGCEDCKDIASEFGELIKTKQPLHELIEQFVAHYNEKHLEEYYDRHPASAKRAKKTKMMETAQVKEKIIE